MKTLKHLTKENIKISIDTEEEFKVDVPLIYAILPVIPLILLIIFSESYSLFTPPIILDTTTAMLISLFVALLFEFIRKRNLKSVLNALKSFWDGMGQIFSSKMKRHARLPDVSFPV